ncbi:hypothetical protein B296_00024494 [Ensete ventricosum]|uniref:Uncharacterized protein n=1 Tax=Ensete ventricosum TaxID=4639 RepID=A0A426ZSN6_ENSVE|nr:hypothetical protein B296_00024494 [Ensete ventricosum]
MGQANRELQNWKCSLNQSGDKRGRWGRTLAVIVRSHWPHAQPTHGDWRAKAATNRWEWLPYLLLVRPRATPRPGPVPTAGRDLWELLVRARPPPSCLRVHWLLLTSKFPSLVPAGITSNTLRYSYLQHIPSRSASERAWAHL